MRAALIGPCRRRALRHPVPEAPEPAFIVFRARRHAIFALGWLFFFLVVGLYALLYLLTHSCMIVLCPYPTGRKPRDMCARD